MAIGQNFYSDGSEIEDLYRSQANQSIGAGGLAAGLADPFKNERAGYQNQLRGLMANPGEFSSSPVYKFAYDQGLNALQRKGNVRSGNKLAALMKYGQDSASQMYFPQANLLSTLSGATTGSPAAAGLAVSGAFNRSQDQRQAGMASGMYGRGGGMGGGSAGGGGGSQTPWWMAPMQNKPFDTTPMTGTYSVGGYAPQNYMPSGGYGGDYGGSGGGYDLAANYDPYSLGGYSDYGDWTGGDYYSGEE